MVSKRRRRFLELVAATGTVAVAGCGGDDSGGADDSNDDGGDESSSPSGTGESGLNREVEIAQSLTDYVDITAVEEVEVTDTYLEVNVTYENLSDESAAVWEYATSLFVYPTDEPGGNRPEDMIQTNGTDAEYDTNEQEPVEPGETRTLGFSITVAEESDETIGSYKLFVTCGGVYEPPGCG